MSMNKIVLIIPFYGKFPNYFSTWLKSVEHLAGFIDFLLITDIDTYSYTLPASLKVVNLTFKELQKRATDRGIKPPTHPYKLCDFKPVYGFLFEDMITQYLYWGYCDVDTVMGDVQSYLEKIEYTKYDRVGEKGHFTIYKNNQQCRELFKSKACAQESRSYDFDFVTRTTYACHFDEEGMNKICNTLNLSYYEKNHELQTTEGTLHIHSYGHTNDHELFVFEDGHTYMYRKDADGKITKQEGMYIHFQYQKNMPAVRPTEWGGQFMLTPEGFIPFDKNRIEDYLAEYGRPDTEEESIDARKKYVKALRRGRFVKLKREISQNGFSALLNILSRIRNFLKIRKYGNI